MPRPDAGPSTTRSTSGRRPTFWGPTHPIRPIPVLVDPSFARPAGRIVARGGQLIRPVQDCAKGYGRALALARIDRLDETSFAQTIDRPRHDRPDVARQPPPHRECRRRDRMHRRVRPRAPTPRALPLPATARPAARAGPGHRVPAAGLSSPPSAGRAGAGTDGGAIFISRGPGGNALGPLHVDGGAAGFVRSTFPGALSTPPGAVPGLVPGLGQHGAHLHCRFPGIDPPTAHVAPHSTDLPTSAAGAAQRRISVARLSPPATPSIRPPGDAGSASHRRARSWRSPELAEAQLVGAFWPIRSEVDPRPADRAAASPAASGSPCRR